MDHSGWRVVWLFLAAMTGVCACLLWFRIPEPSTGDMRTSPFFPRILHTLRAAGPWHAALAFFCYSGQWLAVVGFLPTIVARSGLSPWVIGLVAAGVSAANILGNAASGRLLQRGVPAPVLLAAGFAAMALATLAAVAGAGAGGLPLPARYGALLAFSALGGLIPGTLFSMAVRVAPGESTVATTVGWMQQWSSLGQLGGPPLVAAVASVAGGWHFTWVATGALSLAGLVLTAWLARLARPQAAGDNAAATPRNR